MTEYRKPIPKTQREISVSQHSSYDPQVGNPNNTYQSKTNRGNNVSFKGDKTKPFNIGIYDLDSAILYYFENTIKPYVVQNNENVSVPIIYSSPEKWKSYQKDGYYRDNKGAIMSPIITLRRNSIEKLRNISNKLDANSPINYGIFEKTYSKKNFYDNFSILNNTVPEKTFYAVVIPDYVSITYDCVMFTYYVEQMNKLIEMVQYASDSYWGDPERFKFKVSINSFSEINEISEGDSRLIKCTFSIKLVGYLSPDIIQKDLNSIKKYFNKSKLTFTLETVDGTLEQFDALMKSPTVTKSGAKIIDSQNIVINNNTNNNLDSVSSYLNTNIQLVGTYVNSTTITFSYGWLTAPTGLTPTSLNNFVFFVNGVLIEKTAIVSFTDNITFSTLVIDPNLLGYNVISTDEIIGIGKFNTI